MRAKFRPLLLRDENDCDASTGKVLLVTDVLVRGEKDVEAGIFRGLYQIAILKAVPTLLRCCSDLAIGQKWAQRDGRGLIEEHALHWA